MKIILGLSVLLGTGLLRSEPLAVIAIQPLGPINQADLKVVADGIRASYAVMVEILPPKPLPDAAYYAPRRRYKAEGITEDLVAGISPKFKKIIGVTASDISTTKDDGKDWGIMGLGQYGGKACVISTFRLGKNKIAPAIFEARFVKVVNHELGHTFGLPHCETAGCLMQDKHGKVATVDSESGKPCEICAARLPLRN